VCHRELVELKGGHAAPFALPLIAGHEFAGVVVAIGYGGDGHEGVASGTSLPAWLRKGARVVNLHQDQCGQCRKCRDPRESTRWCENSTEYFGVSVDGSYGPFVRAKANSLVPLPVSIDFAEGCFLSCTAAVALRALQFHANLQTGERVLITGATGGVGIHALQLVKKVFQGRVVAVTSSQAKANVLKEYGADEVVVCTTKEELQQFHHKIKPPVDVALECVGIPTLNASIRSLRSNGRLVILGNVTAGKGSINPGLLILKELKIFGSSSASREELQRVLGWTAEGKLKPVLHCTMPLEAAHKAHELLADREAIGRIVLVPTHSTAQL